MKANDGGAAFPAELSNSGPQAGMSLRDWFASRAPEPPAEWFARTQGLDKSEAKVIREGGDMYVYLSPAQVAAATAEWKYLHADAMLAHRAKEVSQ